MVPGHGRTGAVHERKRYPGFLKGKPQHDRDDPFRIRHPKMPCDKRAKIFSPFDALKGFSEALAAQEALKEDECAADTGLKNPRS